LKAHLVIDLREVAVDITVTATCVGEHIIRVWLNLNLKHRRKPSLLWRI